MAAHESGLQIDLDAGEGTVVNGHITDFIANPCTMLNIEFNCKDFLVFHPNKDNYFRFLTLEWIPLNFTSGQGGDGVWNYKIQALPKQMFKLVDKPCVDLRSLASFIGVELNDGSSNLPVKCPVINQPVYALMRIIRLQSFNDAAIKRQMGEAYFLYCNSHTLTAQTWQTMTQSKANSLEIPEGLAGSDVVSIYDSRVENYLMTPAYPRKWVEEDYLRRLNGVTYEMKTLQPALFAQMYTIKFTNSSQMDSPEPMLCFYTDCDLMNNNRMVNRYAQILFD